VRGDNAREAAERFVSEGDDQGGRVLIGGVAVYVAVWSGKGVAGLVRDLRFAVEELIRERDKEVAEAAGLLLRDYERDAK
jgi:hypothetical protein